MEPLEQSQETLPQSETAYAPSAPKPARDTTHVYLVVFVLAALLGASYWTYAAFSHRPTQATDFDRSPIWTLETAAHPYAKAFVRTQDTSFWSSRTTTVLTTDSTVASQDSSIALVNSRTKARVVLAPRSVVSLDRDRVRVISGYASFTNTATNETSIVLPPFESNGPENEISASLEPVVGTIHDLQVSERIGFSWPKGIQGSEMFLEFAREPEFASVLFTQAAGTDQAVSVPFQDRSPGAWFARLRTKEKVLGYTAFNLVESQTPDQLTRMGRRWFTWRDRALAAVYRLEFSNDETFKQIAQSFQVRNREFDLSRVTAGRYFLRVTSIAISGQESPSRPMAIEVQDKTEMLRAGLELNDPDLKLFARGWKIVLQRNEASRIREGFVILRESELRGVKVADELFKGIEKKDYVQRAAVLKSVIFELSRDESFSNPERVKPDAQGELLPPALPLGILYARLRRIESDGTLGSYGPPSRLTTYLPAPVQRKTSPLPSDATEVLLKWDLETAVAGFELRVGSDPQLTDSNSAVVQTRETSRKVAVELSKDFFWNVTALNEFGQRVSMPSDVQEVRGPRPVERKMKALVMKTTTRDPAMLRPLVPVLKQPLEDAIVIGGMTAKKYGKLKWEFDTSTGFEVQIATDGDFVNIIEKAKIDASEYALQGDLPEGALFWRVRKLKTKQWSESRRFELVYE